MSYFTAELGRSARPAGPKGLDWPGREGSSYVVKHVRALSTTLEEIKIEADDQHLLVPNEVLLQVNKEVEPLSQVPVVTLISE